jgi:hypothetical protein
MQLGESSGPAWPAAAYREGFRDHIEDVRSSEDVVILAEPDPGRAELLKDLWRGSPNASVVQAHAEPVMAAGDIDYFTVPNRPGQQAVFSHDLDRVLTFDPATTPERVSVASKSVSELLALGGGGTLQFLSLDVSDVGPGWEDREAWWAAGALEVHLTSRRAALLRRYADVLRSAGYEPAGRQWGEAGSGVLFRRVQGLGPGPRARSLMGEGRIRAGVIVAKTSKAGREIGPRLARVCRSIQTYRTTDKGAKSLDYSDGRRLSALAPEDVYAISRRIRELDIEPVPMMPVDLPDIDALTEACYQRHGVYPLSFSYPGEFRPPLSSPAQLLSHITPGFPYSFSDEIQYLDTYADSVMAVTHRKAGWDCFRHLEILAAGSVPIMLDADQIPEFCMVHYPKRTLERVLATVKGGQGCPDADLRNELHLFAERHLTSEAMASYLLRTSGFADAGRVLFVDERLPSSVDYLSLTTLIGLKRIPALTCVAWRPVDYVYANTTVDTSRLYGRGFGVTRVLADELRHEEWLLQGLDLREAVRQIKPDVVVVGSIDRNWGLATQLAEIFPAENTIWVHGEDDPPDLVSARRMWASGSKVFVRAIEGKGNVRVRL